MADQHGVLPERRAVSTMQALQALGLSPAIIILVAFCFMVVWYAFEKSTKDEAYSRQMIDLVTTIQQDQRIKNKQDSDIRVAMIAMVNSNTQKIITIETILKNLGLPLYTDEQGKTYLDQKTLLQGATQ